MVAEDPRHRESRGRRFARIACRVSLCGTLKRALFRLGVFLQLRAARNSCRTVALAGSSGKNDSGGQGAPGAAIA